MGTLPFTESCQRSYMPTVYINWIYPVAKRRGMTGTAKFCCYWTPYLLCAITASEMEMGHLS